MKSLSKISLTFCIFLFLNSCAEKKKEKKKEISTEKVAVKSNQPKIKIIFDTDANNELDDQHALAYMLFSGTSFDVKGVTVNATSNDQDVQGHYDEAERIMQLCNLKGAVPLLKGAEGNFKEIIKNFDPTNYDGQEGVEFLLEETKKDAIIIVAVGKLTNIALALKKDPSFAKRAKIVWLGSNYPDPGEYNQDNDIISMNYVLNSNIPFEMVTVRSGEDSGTDAVSVTKKEINEKMPGLGPKAIEPITGRHGGTFETFGDYSVNLFDNIFNYFHQLVITPTRPLFDMVALAIVKDGSWGQSKTIAAPIFISNEWVERPENTRKIVVWENFEKEKIVNDFFRTMKNPVLISKAK